MSKQVDEKVVSMQFDNKNFEKNVQTTLGTLDKLKQGLNLTGATKGLENVGTAAKKVDLSGISSAAETVRMKFSSLEVMAITTLANITNSAVNAGKRIVSALTIDPIKTGFQEYETQINAVQTILANTESKGTTLEDVNSALDTLNTYADKTIYNFTEMTKNIGTFTAAGVDLDTSVNAIQGIANLAAVSGSTSQQASTAMYQLSQALSSGTVKLMDWNSVVNAGMGGQVFQDALKQTARVHGVNIDAMIKKQGSFRETLQEGWLTADILTETLQQFTMAAEEGSDEWNNYKKSLMDTGYSEEQALAILKMANTATDAATKVKTFTQLWDTLKETAQSGWTQTWEIIMGDFEEAKSLFSEIYNTLSPVLEASSKARNDLLQGWSDLGGRTKIIESLRNMFEGIVNIVKPIKEAFREIFPPTTSEQLYKFTESFKNLTDKFVSFTEKNGPQIKSTFKGIFAFIDIGVELTKALNGVIFKLLGYITPTGKQFLDTTASIGDFIVKIRDSIKAGDVFNKVIEKIGNFLKPVAEGVKSMVKSISDSFGELKDKTEVRIKPLSALGNALKVTFVAIGKVIGKVMPIAINMAKSIGSVISSVMEKITSSIENADYKGLFDILNSGIFSAIGIFIAKFIKSGGDLLDNAGGILENIKQIIGGVGDALGAFTQQLKAKTLKEIATAIAILAASLFVISLIDSEKLTASLLAVTAMFAELMGSLSIFSKMSDGKDFAKVTVMAKIMKKLASALLVLAIAMKIMGSMSWGEMGRGLISLTVGMGVLAAAVNILPEKKLRNSTKAIRKLASSMIVLAIALKIMGSMSWKEMGVALISMAAGLGMMVGAVYLLPTDTSRRAAGLIGLATAIAILGAALKIMGSMTWEEMGISLISVAGGLGMMVAAVNLLPKDTAIKTLGMVGLATALVIMAGALKIMGSMTWEEIAKGLVTLAGSLTVITVAMNFMQNAIPGAAALLLIAGALAILTPVLKTLGSMTWGEIAKGLIALAGAFAVIGAAGYLLASVVTPVLALAAAFALFGIGLTAIGVGVLAFSTGLATLGAALAVNGAAIVTFVTSTISLIPFLFEQAAIGIIKSLEVIAGSADALFGAITVIIQSVVEALVTCIPTIVEGILQLIVKVLSALIEYLPQIVPLITELIVTLSSLVAEQLPTIVESILQLLAALLNAIADNLSILIDPIVSIIGAIFEALAAIIGPVIQEVIVPLLSELIDLFVEIFEILEPHIPVICDLISNMVTVISDALVKIFEAMAPYMPEITKIVELIINSTVEITQCVADLIEKLIPLVSEITEVIGKTITILEDTFNGISNVIDSVGELIKKFFDGLSSVIEAVGEAALNAGTGFDKLANGVKTITNLKLGDMAASLGAVATGLGKIVKHSDGISKTGTGMKKIADAAKISETSFTKAASGITNLTNKLTEIGPTTTTAISEFQNAMTSLGTSLATAIADVSSKTATMTVAIRSMCTTCVSAVKSFNSAMSTAGKHMIDGLANGIRANKSAATRAAREVASAVETIIRSAWQVNSPSKLFYKIALGVGEGITGAFGDSITSIRNSTRDLSNVATGGFRDAIQQIVEFMDSDMNTQPTIKPVLDLSEVAAGAGAIGGMFGMIPSIDVLSNVRGINSSMSNRVQNGVNGDVVAALKDLKTSLNGKTGNNYNINGVSYNEGSDVAEAIKVITRAIVMEGRV